MARRLIDLDIEKPGKASKSNIYKGCHTVLNLSLEAAFVDYGNERHGFLPFKEVSRSFFQNPTPTLPGQHQGSAAPKARSSSSRSTRDERGNKGAALTTFISPRGPLHRSDAQQSAWWRRISACRRRDRNECAIRLPSSKFPPAMSSIARTAGRSVGGTQWDLSYLMQLWNAIETAAKQQSAPI